MQYKVEFLDYWHLGSGVSAGARLDALMVKDSNGLPYLPAKTIKGLLREMAELRDKAKAEIVFGDEGAKSATAYFSNATLSRETQKELTENELLIKQLYSKVTSTKIENGIAKDSSLREIEVVIPLTLYGEIETNEPELLRDAMGMIKQMGLGRNRGLGRCRVSEVQEHA